MYKLLDGVDFSSRDLFDCYQHAIEVYLKYVNHNIEMAIFNDYNIYYVKKPRQTYLTASPFDYPKRLAEYGVSIETHRQSNVDRAYRRIVELVYSGKIVPVKADPYHLQYYAIPSDPQHTVHYVIVNGYDQRNGQVHIVDPSPRQRFRGWIIEEELKKAIGSAYLAYEYDLRNEWLEFKIDESRVRANQCGLKQKIVRAADSLLESDGKANEVNVSWGASAMVELLSDSKTWDSYEKVKLAKMLKEWHGYFKRVANMADGYSCFLRSVGEMENDGGLCHSADRMEVLAQTWLLVGTMSLKASLRDPHAKLERIRRKLADINALQSEIFVDLKNICLDKSEEIQ